MLRYPRLARIAALVPALAAAGAAPAPERWSFHSAIEDIRFTPTNGLIRIERATDSADYCDRGFVIRAATPGGKRAERLGWRVTSEERLGPLTAVGIVRSYHDGFSATCWPVDGNIVIFEGARAVGILYAEAKSDYRIGPAWTTWDGKVRLYSLMQLPPIGDLSLRRRTVRLDRLAAVDRFCKGRVAVPSVYNLSIFAARRKLRAAGWLPVPTPKRDYDLMLGTKYDASYHEKGVPEVIECMGTGWGLCLFGYRSGKDRLTVRTTTVDAYRKAVIDVDVTCHR